MATARGVNNTKAQQGPSFVPVTGGDGGGKAGSFYDEFVIPNAGAGSAQNDVVIMGTDKALKKGDRVVSMVLWTQDLGAAATLSVGDSGSATRYVNAFNAHQDASSPLAHGGFGFLIAADDDLKITIGGAAPTAGQKIAIEWRVLRP